MPEVNSPQSLAGSPPSDFAPVGWRHWLRRNVVRICPKSGRFVGFRFKHKWLWILVGTAALVWFLVRVVPKPSRMSYPCQQWAAPAALGFVGWMLSLMGASAAWRSAGHQFRQRRFLAASSLAVIGLLGVLGSEMFLMRSAYAATGKGTMGEDYAAPGDGQRTGTFNLGSEVANAPVGVAKGIHPGRVAWIHDRNASSYNGSGYWWEDRFNDQARISSMLAQVVRSVSGQTTVAASWDRLFRHRNIANGRGDIGFAPTDRIVIKLNLNSGGGNSNRTDSSPHVTFALLDQLVNVVGVPPANITLYDALRGGISAVYNHCQPAFPQVKYNDWGGWAADQIGYSSSSITDPVARRLPQAVIEAHYMINLALLKRHCRVSDYFVDEDGQTAVTLCGKNHFGTIGAPWSLHVGIRDWFWGMQNYNPVVDLMGSRHLGGKTVLYLLDGLYTASIHDGEPLRWSSAPFNNDYPKSLFASQDPVAIDSVGLDFLRSEMSLVANADNYLHEAAARNGSNAAPSGTQYRPDGVVLGSLGVHEHWNNPTSKQYSRNLGNGAGIELAILHPTGTTVGITSPADNATVALGSGLTLVASPTTSGSTTITRIDFEVDGAVVATDASSAGGWTGHWTVTSGSPHGIVAVATDSSGEVVRSTRINVHLPLDPLLSGVARFDDGAGPWGGNQANDAAKAYDGSTATYYDCINADGGYTGIDLGPGSTARVTSIRFWARSQHSARMIGGIFEGSNDPTSGYSTLATVVAASDAAWTTLAVGGSTTFRYLRYRSPSNGFCNVAEIEFRGTANRQPQISTSGAVPETMVLP